MQSVARGDYEAGEIDITAVPSDHSQAGDCLLHGEHHIFDTDCWDYFAAVVFQLRALFPRESIEQTMNRYSHSYEIKILCELIMENR